MTTPERASELLQYDPETGVFTWKVNRPGKAKAGTIAGRPDGAGYWQISIDGRRYRNNRLAWLMSYGEWPPDEVDHINGNKSDDRLENLRAVTRRENMRNKATYKNCRGPRMGVTQRWGRWHVSILGRHLGTFCSAESAIAARIAAEASSGFHKNHGRV